MHFPFAEKISTHAQMIDREPPWSKKATHGIHIEEGICLPATDE